MKIVFEEFAQILDLSPQGVAVVSLAFGVLLICLGLGLMTAILASLRLRVGAGGTHRLLPTLAEEVLDADLGAIYKRSLCLDAQLFNARHAWLEGAPEEFATSGERTRDVEARVGETGSALGRALRKLLLSIQAARFARRSAGEPLAQKNEPPFTGARLVLMNQVLDEAFALEAMSVEAVSSEIDLALDKLTLNVEQARRAFEARVADESSVHDPGSVS